MRAEPDTATGLGARLSTFASATEARRARLAVLLPDVLAAGAVITSGVLLLHWLTRITFWRDEWGVLLHRRGWSVGTFLDPAIEHLIAAPILIYKVLLSTAGMDSPRPFQIVAVLTFLLSVVLLFIYMRMRVGRWLALAAILPVLFLGSAWDDLLFPFQMGFFGSMSCGIGALLAIDRRSRAGDVLATVLLVLGLLFSDLGIPFVAGAVVEVAFDRDRFRRAYVPVIPTVLWLLWYAGWGHTAHTFITFHNFSNLPSYILNGVASSLATLVGLNRPLSATPSSPLDWGRPLLVAAGALAGWRIYRLGTPPARLLAVLAIMLCFWSLTALNGSVFALPTVGRYQYIGIVMLLLVAAELARGLPPHRVAIIALVVVSAWSALGGFVRLRDAAHNLAGVAQRERGALAGLEIARGQVRPTFAQSDIASPAANFLGFLDAPAYFSAVDAYGSPAYPRAELATAPEPARESADVVLGSALDLKLVPAPRGGAEDCGVARVSASAPAVGPVTSGGVVLRRDAGNVRAALRRYASESFPVGLGTVPKSGALLSIPADRSSRPWILQLSGNGRASVCRPAPG